VLLLFLALYVPPNNHDSMTYHMTRVAMYLQQGSLDAFTTPDLRQTVLPANAEILILWSAVLLRHDAAANLVQWCSWVASLVAVFGLARLLGFAAARSLFAALAFGAFPAVVLQATSTQNDLVMAFFVLCAFLFAGTEAMGRNGGTHTLAAIAMGLAVGTKALGLLLVPGLAAFIAASWAWNRGLREAARLALLGVAALSAAGVVHLRAEPPALLSAHGPGGVQRPGVAAAP
jgi:4-amino-4-deoxy-L-arabinose transferase-like glycosyltransferase